jgi:tetratricopeptide (TPR) repeat protein
MFVQALLAARALGLRVDEGRAFACLGRHAMHRGDFMRARTALEHAECICREVGDRPGVGGAQRELGMLACYLGDHRQARDLGQQALSIAQETGQRRAQRFAFRLIGHALAGLGDLLGANVAYLQALEADRMLGSTPLAVESTVDLARLAMRDGDKRRAISTVIPLLDTLRETNLEGTEEPVLIYLTCYNLLNAASDAAAAWLLAYGHTLLMRRAASLSAQERRHYFEDVPAHRELLRLSVASHLGSQEHPDAPGSAPQLAAAAAGDQAWTDMARGASLG